MSRSPAWAIRDVESFFCSLPHTFQDIEGHVDRVLKSLGLQDVAHNRIGTPIQRGISGGQKRRVTIACSMVAKPKILVLDEPTSGLDAASGREVVTSSEQHSQAGWSAVLTPHEPKSDALRGRSTRSSSALSISQTGKHIHSSTTCSSSPEGA